MRGENWRWFAPTRAIGGTSPRARGKLQGLYHREVPIRNIPACAGKTVPTCCSAMSQPEHPRVRGENTLGLMLTLNLTGTSPRARGKLAAGAITAGAKRNIPACAGKTYCCSGLPLPPPEHPRVRGENSITYCEKNQLSGTSPRARGKLGGVMQVMLGWGNIPACAGKTHTTPYRA